MSVFNKTSFVIILFFCYGCEEEVFTLDNPLDPENPEYIPPQITITSGPSDNEVVELSQNNEIKEDIENKEEPIEKDEAPVKEIIENIF